MFPLLDFENVRKSTVEFSLAIFILLKCTYDYIYIYIHIKDWYKKNGFLGTYAYHFPIFFKFERVHHIFKISLVKSCERLLVLIKNDAEIPT